VALTIMFVLVALTGAAVSAARSGGARQKTASTIAAIDMILQQHFTSLESSRAGATGPGTDRAAALRRLLTADMPDSWAEVRHMKSNPGLFGSARHRGYVAFLDTVTPTDQFGDAECLFMIVMQGGLADCLACSALDKAKIGDKDQDGALEFWDEWDEPIRYVLWPAGFELPPGTRLFSAVPPFSGIVPTGATGSPMRPLIFSGGPSKLSSTEIHTGSYLALGNACGDPANTVINRLGGLSGTVDRRADNITNFDGEVKR